MSENAHKWENSDSSEKSNASIQGYVDLKLAKAFTWSKRFWAEVGDGYLRVHRYSKSSKRGQSSNEGIVINLIKTAIGFDDSKCKVHILPRGYLEYFSPVNKEDYLEWKRVIRCNGRNAPATEHPGQHVSFTTANSNEPTAELSNTTAQEEDVEQESETDEIRKPETAFSWVFGKRNENDRKKARTTASDDKVDYRTKTVRTPEKSQNWSMRLLPRPLAARMLHEQKNKREIGPKGRECDDTYRQAMEIMEASTQLLQEVQQKQEELNRAVERVRAMLNDQQIDDIHDRIGSVAEYEPISNRPVSGRILKYEQLSERGALHPTKVVSIFDLNKARKKFRNMCGNTAEESRGSENAVDGEEQNNCREEEKANQDLQPPSVELQKAEA